MAPRLDTVPVFPAMCFGKLPAFGDFVRHNAGGRDALVFDQWLQQGLYHARTHLGAAWDESFRQAPAYYFLFSPESSEGFLLGLLQPSRDRGDRCFPFTVALRVDRRFPQELLPLAPLVFGSFLTRATALAREAGSMSLHEIAEGTTRLDAPIGRDFRASADAYRTWLASTRVRTLRERLWAADGERVLVTFRNLVEVLAPFRGRTPTRLALGLRFPVSADASEATHDVSLWTDTALRLMNARGARPYLFWTAPANGEAPRATATGQLFLFLRQPTARSVMHFLRPDLPSDFICEVDAEGARDPVAVRSALPPLLRTALCSGATSLHELLEMLGRGVPGVPVGRVLC